MDFIFYLIPQSGNTKKLLRQAKIVAHRGWHNDTLPENSIASFDEALKHQLWGIEFDIRWTKDLVPVVHHDPDTSRVWGKNLVIAEHTFEQIRKEVPDIPSLKEVVSKFGKKLFFFIELKKEVHFNLARQKEILKKTLTSLDEGHDYKVMCLFPETIHDYDVFKKENYLLVANFNIVEMSRAAQEMQIGGVCGHYLLTSKNIMQQHRAADQHIGTGFYRHKKILKREIKRGVDWHFTNHPWNLID